MKNSFLLTGATGFIGSNLVRELVRKGEHVSIIVRDKNKNNWRLKDIESKLDIYECNLLSESLKYLINKIRPDFIFHLAAYGIPPEEDNAYEMIDVNLKGTINLIDAVKKIPFKLFVNTGSCMEYGIKKNPMKEKDVLEPIFDYAITKAAATLYCRKEGVRSNLPIVNFRLFTPYGYFEELYRLIPTVVKNAIENKPIKVSTPKTVRDFIFIEDLVDAYLQVTKMPLPNGEIFNIGTGKQNSIGEIVQLCLEISQSKSKVLWGAMPMQKRYIEPDRFEADMSKTKKILNWQPKTTIEEGLKKTVEWFKKNKGLSIYN